MFEGANRGQGERVFVERFDDVAAQRDAALGLDPTDPNGWELAEIRLRPGAIGTCLVRNAGIIFSPAHPVPAKHRC